MTHVSHALVHLEAKWARLVRRFFHAVRSHLLSCSSPNGRYRQLKANLSAPDPTVARDIPKVDTGHAPVRTDMEVDSDVLSLKVSLVGDCDIGKTSFMVYAHAILDHRQETMSFFFLLLILLLAYVVDEVCGRCGGTERSRNGRTESNG